MASLDTVPLGTGTAQAFGYGSGTPCATVQPARYRMPMGPPSLQAFQYLADERLWCWEGLTQSLLGYLARPFTNRVGSRLHTLMSTVARELSGCIETVTMDQSADARGGGDFTIQTRFEPITSVSSVDRVDADGTVLESYVLLGYSGRTITLSGVRAPDRGDRLRVTYTYLHKGLEGRIREALLELNILTSTGEFLDSWGRWFATPRETTGTYGSFKYGSQKYGTTGQEADTPYSRRIIDKITQPRNTKPAITDAVRRRAGGNPYIVEWCEPGVSRGFVFRPYGTPPWLGGANTANHLIWGVSARFLNRLVPGGGACTIEVWVDKDTGISNQQVRDIANQYKAAGIRVWVRRQTTIRQTLVAPLPAAASAVLPATLTVSGPALPTANMLWWFEGDAITAVDGDPLDVWPDQAPDPHDLVWPCTNGGNQPYYRNNGSDNINGLPVVQIAAGDQLEMPYPNFSPALTNRSCTFYWVGNYTTPMAASGILVFNYSTGGAKVVSLYADGVGGASNVGYEYYITSTVDVNLAAAASGVQLLTWVFDKTGGTATLYRNGTQVGTSGDVGSGGYDFGSDFIEFFAVAGGVASFVGKHAAFVGYSVAHDTTTREQVETYLKDKYGIV